MTKDRLAALVLVKLLRYSLNVNCLGYVCRKKNHVSFSVNSVLELNL